MANNYHSGSSNTSTSRVEHSNPGFPFDEWSQSVQDTEQLVTVSQQLQDRAFQPIRTPFSIVLIILCMICLELALFLVPHFCENSTTCAAPPYSILMYSHAGLWFVFMLIDRYWRYQHYKSRTRGYLDFYRHTRHLRRMPILIFSGGMALLLVLTVILMDHCTVTPQDKCPGIALTRCQYVQVLVSLELVIIIPIVILYLVRTIKFNKAQSVPDIQEEEMMGSISASRSLCNGVGFRDDSFVDDILEKQADMIRYLKHHNNHLGRKILQLTAQLEQASS